MMLNKAPMDRIITDSYILATGAVIAFSHGWRYGAPVLPGQVTLRDLYNIIPTNPRLFTLEMEGMDILRRWKPIYSKFSRPIHSIKRAGICCDPLTFPWRSSPTTRWGKEFNTSKSEEVRLS
ncbi:5'-nucleotidase C-terminal domain-containing protein [Paenibacillus thermotolerans]|uniref:5'-nucleotidase C-terminal domain-containing protein n=1 Tax=Paenibacillus thermotolerans TaxID=3027807 RepID=UPI003CC618E3